MGGPGGRNIFSIGKAFPAGSKDLKSKAGFSALYRVIQGLEVDNEESGEEMQNELESVLKPF